LNSFGLGGGRGRSKGERRSTNQCVICGKPSGKRKSCSEECRFEAIRKRRTGMKHSPDTIEKMKTSKRGYKHSLKARLKMSISHMGLKAGSKHPRWGGGPKKQLYCEKWTPELRERVRIRFSHIFGNRQCFECGKLESNNIDKYGKQTRLEVHHVYYNKKMCCDDSERLLIPLCKSCHSKTSAFGRKSKEEWIDYFIGKLNDINFNGVCWISKEEYATHKLASYKLRRSVKYVRQSLKAI
jgi:hypothetical protein